MDERPSGPNDGDDRASPSDGRANGPRDGRANAPSDHDRIHDVQDGDDVVDSEPLHNWRANREMRNEKKAVKCTFKWMKRRATGGELTFGLDNLKTTTAADTTSDNKPSVNAFHAFNAINANASGNKTVVLNFNPNKNGTKTFLTRPRPVIDEKEEDEKIGRR